MKLLLYGLLVFSRCNFTVWACGAELQSPTALCEICNTQQKNTGPDQIILNPQFNS